jgi:hypothetical protein
MKRQLLLVATLLILAGAIKTYAAKTVSSVTVTQVTAITGADTFALLGLRDQPILKIDIVTTGSGSLSLQKIVIKSLNQDNTDIDSIGVYQAYINHFSLAEYPAEDVELLAKRQKLTGDSIVISGLSTPLNTGHNYFWVTMGVKKTAKVSHTLDAYIRAGGIEIGGLYYPTAAASPAGSVPIANVYFLDNFTTLGNWTQPNDTTTGHPTWRTNYGGYGISIPLIGYPNAPKSGKYNAMLQKEASNPYSSWLISKALDLSLSVKPTMVFYNAQVAWLGANDELAVYYKVGTTGTWNLLHSYTLATDNNWQKRELTLPDAAVAKNVYLGFLGTTHYGYGTCVDSMVLFETKVIPREINAIEVATPSTEVVPQGAAQSTIIRTNIRIRGNTNPITINSLTATSLNTNDNDIKASGVRLYYTSDSVFLDPIQCGTAVSIVGGKMTFTGIGRALETGDNYFWLTYDVTDAATIGNTLDAKILQGDIVLSGINVAGPFPTTDQSPDGSRIIKQSIFFDDFENATKGWTLFGKFELGQPTGLGGGSGIGKPDPTTAYSGTNVLGTVLTGTGNYEANLTYATGYTATTPLIDGTYFKNINLSFSRWLNIDNLDTALIEYQYDGETNWHNIWHNTDYVIDTKWTPVAFDLSKSLDRKKFKLRFRLGYSNSVNNFSGWNVDYLFLTADSVKYDVSVTKYYSPNSACGLTANEHIKCQIKNTGPKSVSNIPMMFSTDNGKTFTSETASGTLAINAVMDYTFVQPANFSKAGIYNVIVKAAYPTDDYAENDTALHTLMALPTITLPYKTGFEEDTSFWVSGGLNSSWQRAWPQGSYITYPVEGLKSWKTSNGQGYNQYENSFVESACFNFTDNEKPIIDFEANYYSKSQYDGTILQYTTNGSIWNTVLKDPYNHPSWAWYNDTVIALRTKGWTGQSVGSGTQQKWMPQRQVLPQVLAGQNNVRFRFVFKADSSANAIEEGFAFDDLRILEAPHDAGVVSIDNLTTPSCQKENPELLKVTIKNYGIRDMLVNDTMIVGVKVNRATSVVDTFKLTVAIPVGQSKQITLHKPINLSKAGVDTIRAFTLIEKEPYFYQTTSNDTAQKIIVIHLLPITNLPDSIVTKAPEKLRIQAVDSAAYQYLWSWGGVKTFTTSYVDVKNTGPGLHYLKVTNSVTNCQTFDTVKVSMSISNLGVTSIISPVTDCGFGTAMHPKIEIKNYGNDTLRVNDTVFVATKLGSGLVKKDSIFLTSNVPPQEKYSAILNRTSYNLSTAGLYSLKAYTTMFADPNTANDTTTTLFQIYGYPTPNLGANVKVKALQYTIDAGSGFSSYLWSKDATPTQTLPVDASGDYWVTVTNSHNCPATDTVNVFFAIRDLAVKRLVSPMSACSLPSMSTVACKIVNLGTDTIKAGENIVLSYAVNNGAFIHENFSLPTPLYSNDSIGYTFVATTDLSAIGTYNMTLTATAANDLRRTNDTLHTIVYAHGNATVKLGADAIAYAPEYRLCPGPQFKAYLWPDNSTDSAYIVSQTHYEPSNRYIVKITDIYDCQGTDTVFVSLIINDIGILGITPASTCPVTAPQELSLNIGNAGNMNQTSKTVTLNYWFNDETTAHTESLTFTGNTGTSTIYKLKSLLDLSKPGIYKVFTSIKLAGNIDVRPTNDTLTTFITVNGPPAVSFGAVNDTLRVPLPYSLDPGYVKGYQYLWQNNTTAQTITVNKGTEGLFTVAITDSNTCTSIQKVYVMDRINDLSVVGLTIPYSSCHLPGTQRVGVQVKNTGTLTLLNEPVTIKYTLNDGTEVSKSVTFSGNRDTVRNCYFDNFVDLSTPSSYDFKVSLEAPIDEISTYNTGEYFVNVWGNPKVDFEATLDSIKGNLPITIDPHTPGNNNSYVWQDLSHGTTYSATKSGWYTVTVTSHLCDSTRSVYVKDVTPVTPVDPHAAVVELSDNLVLIVYPNPAHDVFNIDLTVKNNNPVSMELTNSSGVWVLSKKLPVGSLRYFETVDVSQLPKGVYYLRVSQLNKTFVRKILIQ